jgi:hypothetical protein
VLSVSLLLSPLGSLPKTHAQGARQRRRQLLLCAQLLRQRRGRTQSTTQVPLLQVALQLLPRCGLPSCRPPRSCSSAR